jgi:acyl-CoA thioester hydrolase
MSSHQVQMRWRDLDGLGHVNHVVVLTYLEEGRDAFLAGHGIRRDEYVVGRCSVGFNREISAADSVTVECRVAAVGHKSVTTSERILDSDGNVAIEAQFTIVLWDPGSRMTREVTDEERASLLGAEAVAL